MENQNDQVLVTRKTELTSAQKAGYLFAGLLGGAGCAILASLCNIDAPYRSDCTKFALIGLGIRIALSVIGYIAMLPFRRCSTRRARSCPADTALRVRPAMRWKRVSRPRLDLRRKSDVMHRIDQT